MRKTVVEFTDTDLDVICLLAAIGLSAFDAPAGPAYVLKSRLEDQKKKTISEDDFITVMNKLKQAKERLK